MPNIVLGTSRARMNELIGQRADLLKNAEAQLSAGNRSEYDSLMSKAKAMNPQIDDLKAVVDEYDRYDIAHAPTGNVNDGYDVKNMVEMLKGKERVGFAMQDIMPMLRPHDSLLYSGSITNPSETSKKINDGPATQVSTLLDQVRVEVMEGISSYEESYVKTVGAASGGTPADVAGVTPASSGVRTAVDDGFRIAKMQAYNANVTKYADRGINVLTGTPYLTKVQQLATVALRKELNRLIVNGDGSAASTAMFGITTAKNTVGEDIFAAASAVTGIDKATLRALILGFGGEEEVAGNCRLVLSKASLTAFGDIAKGEKDDTPLYDISMSGNVGNIKLGGAGCGYTICSAVGNSKLLYGDPSQYLLPIFGPLTVRIDESYKAGERLMTILGDVFCSGNLVSDKAFSVATLA